jgi:gluconolactonase
MKISNYSLNYSSLLAKGQMDLFEFLTLCREMDTDGASLHVNNLPETGTSFLKRLRRAYLDQGLSISMFSVSTNFGRPVDQHEAELAKAREAIRVATFLGAPLLRVFAGSPPTEPERQAAFDRSVASVRRVCVEAAEVGLPIGLQNHNHGALCRTGDDVLRFIKQVDHPNLTFILDSGQFAGSPGASGEAPAELRDADYLDSIRKTASIARYVRVKFYAPRADGSEPGIDYDQVFNILRSVHYESFVDIVYEPSRHGGDDLRTAIPRVVGFLRSKIHTDRPAPTGAVGRYAGLNTERFIEPQSVRALPRVTFLEGPAVDRAGNVFFTNIPAQRILKWDVSEGKLSVFRENSNAANGLLFDRQGRLLACEGDGRVTRTDMATGRISVLADAYKGHPLGGPNDLTADSRGRIYFTSRLSNRDPAKGNVNAVYRIDPDGSIVRVLAWPDIDMPNGIVTAPDDTTLYLIDADGAADRARRVRAYALKPDGTTGDERLLYDFYPGRSGDGMAIDAESNLYVAAGLHRRRGSSETLDTRPGMHVISPAGKLLAFVETPEDTITNCTFGGPDLRTLYVTCGKMLLSMRTRIPGKAAYRPEA